ncbi:MAG: iron hydrogenase [Herbinix sp.]|jgi:NADH:ubiquinone oxidoreductase subunit E|nr:iron hydrogenase [Herbinix sp.]
MGTAEIKFIIKQLGEKKAPLLQVLLAIQDATPGKYLSEEAVNEIARILEVSRCRVYSTASFYSEISLKPRGLHLIRVCTNSPCENAGKEEIHNAIEQELGITIGQTTPDGIFTLESVNCLGACFMSPAIKVDDTLYGNLTPESVVSVLNSFRKEQSYGCI